MADRQPTIIGPLGRPIDSTGWSESGGGGSGPLSGAVDWYSSLIRHPIDTLTGAVKSPGYDTAAAGAKEAQAYLQQLSQTAWDRQMQGLQGALGSFKGYDALSSQMNPRHGGTPQAAAGGGGGGVPGGQGAGGPPLNGPPLLPPPGTPMTGYRPPSNQPPHFAPPELPPPGTPSTGYAPPPSQPGHIPATAPPLLPPPGGLARWEVPSAPPSNGPPLLPPPGSVAPPALPPPGAPAGAPPVLQSPGIMDLLAQMTTARSGRGSF